jgi:predicted P-loop ATPase
MFNAAEPLCDAGIALHWLRERSKAPIDASWSDAPVASIDDLKKRYRKDANIGVRLGQWSKTDAGYLHLIDLDIREDRLADEAYAKLREMIPELDDLPCVASGSGGQSRHFYFVCEEAYASKKLVHSDGFSMVFDPTKNREVKRWHWEIELFGTGKQAVLPPSIHPDTGNPYRWERELDLEDLAFGIGPDIASERVESWGAWRTDNTPVDDDDLLGISRAMPMGLSADEIREAVFDLPKDEFCEDRDGWLQVGMALHHEHEGSKDGLKLWNEWSSQSKKFDADDQARVWKSFGERRGPPVRMATIMKAAGTARLKRDYDLVDEDEDLLGELPATVKPDYDPNWLSYLELTDKGTIKANAHNIGLIVMNDERFRGVVGHNEFTQETVQIGLPGKFKMRKAGPKPIRQLDSDHFKLTDPINGDLWSDLHDAHFRLILETPRRQGGYGMKVSDRDLNDAIRVAAEKHKFHPVRRYLESVRWDGIPRMKFLFSEYLGATDDEYHRGAAAMFLLGAVVRVFEPGHKFDFVPILEGIQGKRKSTFVATLARHDAWFAELEGDFHDTKGMVERMQGAWILELPELQGFSRAEVTTIKGFVSRLKDKCRLAYERRAKEFPRQCVFLGTTNEEQYLRDATGNRRFWPVHCDVNLIDIEKLRDNVDQIWAEAYTKYRQMRDEQPYGALPLYLRDRRAQELAEEAQADRSVDTIEHALAGEISEALERPIADDNGFDDIDEPKYWNEVCGKQIWVKLLGRRGDDYDHRNNQLVGRAMKLVDGWERLKGATKRFGDWGKQRTFIRTTPK